MIAIYVFSETVCPGILEVLFFPIDTPQPTDITEQPKHSLTGLGRWLLPSIYNGLDLSFNVVRKKIMRLIGELFHFSKVNYMEK